jgi:hypothetical protein
VEGSCEHGNGTSGCIKCRGLLSDFNQNWNLHTNFSTASQCQLYGTLLNGHMRADMGKLIVTFFADVPCECERNNYKNQRPVASGYLRLDIGSCRKLYSLIMYQILFHDAMKTLIDRPSCYSNKLLIIHAFASVSILMHIFPLIKSRLHCNASPHGS